MRLQEWLNADIGAVFEKVRQGFSWWTDELAQMVPERWRIRSGAGRPIAEMDDTGRCVRLWRQGRFSERPLRGGGQVTADLALPPASVLVQEVVLPPLAASDLRRLVTAEMDRLTPFTAEAVYFDIERPRRDLGTGHSCVSLAVVPRHVADQALEQATGQGLTTRRLGLLGADRRLVFDFTRSMRETGHGRGPDNGVLSWWIAAAVLLLVNIGLLVGRDINAVQSLRQSVDLQQPTVALAQRLRGRVEGDIAGRRDLLQRRAQSEPLKVLDAASRAFPVPQWIQRLEWNGHTVRIVGFRTAGFDVPGAVRASRILGNPRSLTAPTLAGGGSQQPFDVVADTSVIAGAK